MDLGFSLLKIDRETSNKLQDPLEGVVKSHASGLLE